MAFVDSPGKMGICWPSWGLVAGKGEIAAVWGSGAEGLSPQ